MTIKRCYPVLVGATVNVNQLVEDGNFESTSVWFASNASYTVENNIATVTPISQYGRITSNAIDFIGSHKYFMTVDVKCNYAINIRAYASSYFAITAINLNANEWKNFSGINTATTGRNGLIIQNNSAVIDGMVFNIKNVMLFDLTAMLGSTIADYLYSLERATAGAGIAKLRGWGFLTDEYIPYNAGTLESVEATAHKMVGFNQWDEEWELGLIDNNTGANVASSNYIRSKNYIPVLPNITYYIRIPVGTCPLYFYDADKTYITPYFGDKGNTTFTTPSKARYMRFRCGSNYGTTYNHDICINLSNPDRNGEYEPYHEYSYPLDSTVTLRGIPKLDSNNDLYYDGDRYESDGTVTRRYGITAITGDSNISAGSSGMLFKVSISGKKSTAAFTSEPNGICDKLTGVKQSSTWGVPFTFSFTMNQDYMYFKLSDSITTIEDAKTYLASKPITVVYELATPTTETADPFTNPQICDPDGTEEYVTSNGVPVGHETKYQL